MNTFFDYYKSSWDEFISVLEGLNPGNKSSQTFSAGNLFMTIKDYKRKNE